MHKEPDAKPTLPDCDIYNSSLFVPKSTEVVRIAVGNLHAGEVYRNVCGKALIVCGLWKRSRFTCEGT